MRPGPALGSTVLIGLVWTFVAVAEAKAGPPVDAPTEASPDDPQKAAAKAEVATARTAFSSGDYATAIHHYEAAIAILPAPKLHYNIGVCHQRLALEAASSEDRTRERELAVESYNRYLELNPGAEDRLAVAETIRELGGIPVTMPSLKPLFDGEPEPSEPLPSEPVDPFADLPVDDAEPTEPVTDPAPPPRKPPYPKHGRFGIALAGGFAPDLLDAEAVDAPGLFAIELHGGGMLGPRRRFLLAAHTLLYGGATLNPNGYPIYGFDLGLLGEQTWVLAHEAILIGAGGVVALTGQSLNERTDEARPICSLERDSAQIAGRLGGVFGPRFDLGILMGNRRRSMINLLVQPSLAVFGDGASGSQCPAGETPWTALGVDRRLQFQLWLGAGYAFRF